MNLTHVMRPATLAEACEALAAADGDGKIVAGGTALVLMQRQRLLDPTILVDVSAVTDRIYRGISVDAGWVRIGGGETLASIADSPLVQRTLPSLAVSCALVGNIRIRNRATLAGNLAEADYASDPPSVLVSLGAHVVVAGPSGTREVPCAELITGFYSTAIDEDEVIAAVNVPVPAGGSGAAYLKFSSRSSEDRPCVGVAAVLRRSGGRIDHVEVVVGAVADTPQRVPGALGEAIGHAPTAATFGRIAEQYAEQIEALDDHRASQWYRTQMIRVHVVRALHEAARRAA